MQTISKETIYKTIESIQEEKKNLKKLLEEIEKIGLIRLQDKNTRVRNINKFHDVRFRKSILNLKNKIGYIKEFSPHNIFIPLISQISPEINTTSNKKHTIKKTIENKKVKGHDQDHFILSIFKDDVQKKIKREIEKEAKILREKLEELSKIVYYQYNLEKKENTEKISSIKEKGTQPLTKTGKFWDFLIATTPDKKILASYIDILLNFSLEEILSMDKRILRLTNTTFFEKVKTFKKAKNINLLQPIRTSLLLFNQYLSQLEREIALKKYYREQNFSKKYKTFLNEIEKIKEIFNLKIELTKAQKILTFSYTTDIENHLKTSKTIQPITLINTSEVGTGKTLTIPFLSYIIGTKYVEKYKRKPIFLIITEANLLLETKQKLTKEMGLNEKLIEIIETNNIEKTTITPWKIYLISKNRIQLINKKSIQSFSKKCKKNHVIVNLILDEASYLKNNLSKTSVSYSNFKSKLIKEKVLGFEILMTATPISNSTADIPYMVNPNKKVIQKLQQTGKYQALKNSFKKTSSPKEDLSFREALKIAAYKYNRPIKIENTLHMDAPSTILNSAYMSKHFTPRITKENQPEKNQKAILMNETGLLPSKKGEIPKKGVKTKETAIKLIDCLSDLSDIKGIDRILNSEDQDINTSVQINSIILETNFIEAVAFHEMIKNARIISNLQQFKELENTVREFNVTIKKLQEEKFHIRHFIISNILNDLNLIKIEEKKKKIHRTLTEEDEERTIRIYAVIMEKERYINTLEEMIETNRKTLIENILLEINPTAYFKIKETKNLLQKETSNEKRKELENVLKKLETTLRQEVSSITENKSKNIETQIIETLKKDLQILKKIPGTKLEFIPVSLSSYSTFIDIIENDLRIEPKLNPIFENPALYEKIINSSYNHISTYATIFQASESLNMPIISKHLKKTARTVKNLIESELSIKIENFDFEKMTEFISKNASSVINTMRKVNQFTHKKRIPVLITTNYKDSIELIKTDNDLIISGNLSQTKRKGLIDQANRLENNKNVIATAQSIMKGISFYHLPYGIIPESPQNAEYRIQIAGRLRNLFEKQIKELQNAKNTLKEKSQCIKLLLENQKYFDIISSEIMLSFPNIQQEKNILIEAVKFLSQHQGLTNLEVKDTLSNADTKFKYKFNKQLIEKYSERLTEEKIKEFTEWIKSKEKIPTDMKTLIQYLKEYLNIIAERNLKKTTIFKISA